MLLLSCNSDAIELPNAAHLVIVGAFLTWLRNFCQQLPHISNFVGYSAFVCSCPTNCADVTLSLPNLAFETSFGFASVIA